MPTSAVNGKKSETQNKNAFREEGISIGALLQH
jgi:hypothetical protein